MHSKRGKFLIVLIAGLYLFAAPSNSAAQLPVRIPIVDIAPKAAPAARTTRRARSSTRRVETRVITKTETVRVNNLIVSTEPGAKVVLEFKGPKSPPRQEIAGATGAAIFENLKVGSYQVLSSKDNFESAEADNVRIAAQKSHSLDLELKEITYDLKIKTNLTGGDVLFAQAIKKPGKDAKGAIISEQLGNYCVVKIQPNGEAVISDLKKGYYDIDIKPTSLEFDVLETGIDLPDDIEQDDDALGLKTFDLKLEKSVSTETFNPTAWTAADWSLPAAWKLDRGIKVKNAAGVALPQNVRYRNYVNFEMLADVKLRDDGTIGFVLRAADDKNYYLLQISGPGATANPNTALLFTVKNSISQPVSSLTTIPFAKTLASDNGFRVIIRNDAKGFTVWIEDSDTGARHAVGNLPDQYNTFRKGAVGIAGFERSNFEVNYFAVCSTTCSK